jgi:hypothetical protein
VNLINFSKSLNSLAAGRTNSKEIDTLGGQTVKKIDTLEGLCSKLVVLCYKTETLEHINVFFMLWRIILL